jgi:hypothetical protein
MIMTTVSLFMFDEPRNSSQACPRRATASNRYVAARPSNASMRRTDELRAIDSMVLVPRRRPAEHLRLTEACRQRPSMRWSDVRAVYPDRRLVIEALEAHTVGNRWILDRIAVVDVCQDGRETMKRYGELHRQHPQRELCFVHTLNVALDIEERRWIGIRGLGATAGAAVSPRSARAAGPATSPGA